MVENKFEGVDRVDLLASDLNDAVNSELKFLRNLSKNELLRKLGTNLGSLEAVLIIIKAGDEGIAVTKVLESIETSFVSHSSILKRLRVLRELGLIDEEVGKKRSSVRLVRSKYLLEEFGQLLLDKYVENH